MRQRGFTLIELLIAVVIVSILAAIALPSYRSSVVRSNRADAQQALLVAAQNLERYYATNGASGYVGSSVSPAQSPLTGTTVYNLAFTTGAGNPSANTFLIRATPVAGGVNANDGYLEIDQQGVKRWDRNNNGTLDTGEDNWNR